MDNLKNIDDYPDISFTDGYTLEKLYEDMLDRYKEKYKELTGKDTELYPADERRIKLQAVAYFIFQICMMIDDAGKSGLLKYARGDYLENLGALKGESRKNATGAHTTIRFHIQQERVSATGIPAGTRVTAGNNIYFATDGYEEIAAGSLFVDAGATCMTVGAEGNYLGKGEINILVDPVPFISAVENITMPENGTDRETDESLRNRIFKAPSGYSSAGTKDAYEYFIQSFNPGITDIKLTSPEPRIVKVQYLLEDGRFPEEESMNALKEYLEREDIKAMTDVITVEAPEKAEYDLSMKYFINRSDEANAEDIRKKVSEAVEEYKKWQSEKIGRDINPDKLRQLVIDAGAKRTEITSPVYTKVNETAAAVLGSSECIYGGLEDD